MTCSRARFCMAACAALALMAGRASGTLDPANSGGPGAANDGLSQDPFANLPSTAKVLGVVRDFKPTGSTGGHPDFEFNAPGGGGAVRCMELAIADGVDRLIGRFLIDAVDDNGYLTETVADIAERLTRGRENGELTRLVEQARCELAARYVVEDE